jgi:hypothetical protein
MTSCSWTKLLLDSRGTFPIHDDPELQLEVDQARLRLPHNCTAQQVHSDFLKEVHKYVTTRLIKQFSKQVLESTPMDCWLTVPAVWSDQALSATKAAAQAAGFGSRPQDTINIISEPEAGAIAALHTYTQPGSLRSLRVRSPIDDTDTRRRNLLCPGIRERHGLQLRRQHGGHHSVHNDRNRAEALQGAFDWNRY